MTILSLDYETRSKVDLIASGLHTYARDPFGGSGTTAGVALKHGRNAILCELNPEYAAIVPSRIADIVGRP